VYAYLQPTVQYINLTAVAGKNAIYLASFFSFVLELNDLSEAVA
jgi:hypothetical protein